MAEEKRFVLTQEHIAMLDRRRALDIEFAEFMKASISDRKDIRVKVDQLENAVNRNTRTINEVHTALFAKDDRNEFGTTGLVVNMQKVVTIAKFVKWMAITVVATASAFVTLFQLAHAWGSW